MNLMLALDATLTEQLQQHANSRQVSPEQLARDLLGAAIGKMTEDEKWDALNHRRVELIRKSRDCRLTKEEDEELGQLQSAVDQRLEPMDKRLLAMAEHLRQLAEGLPDEPSP